MPYPFYSYYPPGAMPMPQHFNPTVQTVPIPIAPHEKLPSRTAYMLENGNQEKTDSQLRINESNIISPQQESIPTLGQKEIMQRNITGVAKEKTPTTSPSKGKVNVDKDSTNTNKSNSQGVSNDILVTSTQEAKDSSHSSPETGTQENDDGLKETIPVKGEGRNEGKKRNLASCDAINKTPSPKKSRGSGGTWNRPLANREHILEC